MYCYEYTCKTCPEREREREREVLQRHIVCPSFSLDYIKSFMRNGTLYKTHLSPVLFQ